jgi:hypothetical protein
MAADGRGKKRMYTRTWFSEGTVSVLNNFADVREVENNISVVSEGDRFDLN